MANRLNPFKKAYSEQEEELFSFLQKNFIFAGLSKKEMYEFLTFLYPRDYTKNEVIFFRGDPSQALYLLRKGSVSIRLDIQETFEELVLLKPTEVFGENALIEGKTRFYNAICQSESCSLFVIPTTNIMAIFEEHLKIKAKMLWAMTEHYNELLAKIFAIYKSSFGFFDLRKVYERNEF